MLSHILPKSTVPIRRSRPATAAAGQTGKSVTPRAGCRLTCATATGAGGAHGQRPQTAVLGSAAGCGFKEIEVAFLPASQTDFQLCPPAD